MRKKVLLVGGFSETIELCEDNDYEIIGVIDKVTTGKLMGYPVLGNDNDAEAIYNEYGNLPVIVSPDLPSVRMHLVSFYKRIGFTFQSVISNKATISKYSKLEEGIIISNGCNVSAMTKIGSFVRLNVNSNVMHDCKVGSFTTVAPNAVLLGHVTLGEQVYVGANSTILPHISVDGFSTIGAGAVVTKNVIAHVTVKGVPAK